LRRHIEGHLDVYYCHQWIRRIDEPAGGPQKRSVAGGPASRNPLGQGTP